MFLILYSVILQMGASGAAAPVAVEIIGAFGISRIVFGTPDAAKVVNGTLDNVAL